jgi:hypothetical protein
MENDIPSKSKLCKEEATTLLSIKIDFMIKTIRDKEGHYSRKI